VIPTYPLPLLPQAWNGFTIIHFFHSRLLPLAILAHVVIIFIRVMKEARGEASLRMLGQMLLILVAVQVALGISVIWVGRPPTITTLHQTNGALFLVTAVLFVVQTIRLSDASSVPAKNLEAVV
jgi:heme A synthase